MVRDMRKLARAARRRPADKGVTSGQLSGLRETGPARIVAQPAESVYHHAGYLWGHLMRWLFERRRVLAALKFTAAAYASAIADPSGQALLGKPDSPMTAHSYAAIRCEKEAGHALPEADERMFFEWLLEQTRTSHTEELRAKFQRLRDRRLERLGF